MPVRVAEVAFDPRDAGRNAVYTYEAAPGLHVGQVVFAPLGNRSLVGVILRVDVVEPDQLGFPVASLRSIEAPVLGLEIPRALLEMAEMIRDEFLCPLPTALVPILPAGIKERAVGVWTLAPGDPGKLTPVQAEVVQVLRQLGDWVERKGSMDPGALKQLRVLRQKGIVERHMRLPSEQARRKRAGKLALSRDDEKIERFLREEGRRKPAQAMVLLQLQEAGSSQFEAHEIKAMTGVTDTTLRALVQEGLLEEAGSEDVPLETAPRANVYQSLAIEAINEAVRGRESRSFLLYGVTGSGKTEVYLRAIAEALQAGRQALYLVPEIALATQSIARLRARFGSRVAVLHSELTPLERLTNWMRIRSGECPIVLGARSAIFAPLENLGVLIVDEEHEASYKQESAPRYHAKRLAMFLRDRHKCPVVFGSATPSLETYAEAEREVHTLIALPSRATVQELPPVHVVDLRGVFQNLFADPIPARIADTLARGRQAILFLNRRAYAPFLQCRDCGTRQDCPRCTVALSFHRAIGWMQCHQCGYRSRPPDLCPNCGGDRVKPMGIGTEKVEELVREQFPTARVARLDRDIASQKGAAEATLAAFRAGEIDILVGTQMVAKGLDFPNVTLVVVVSADVSLGVPDFRASERTFQLLSQVAGRAGRGTEPGEVYIQTFLPDHLSIRAAQQHDYPRLYEALRQEREATLLPPYSRLVNVVCSGRDRERVRVTLETLAKELQLAGFPFLGPVDCPLERLKNRHRRHLVLKLPVDESPAALRPFLREVEFALEQEEGEISLVVDVDAYSFM